MRIVIIGAMASMVAACASIGRPEGGPRDVTPPEYVRANPAPGSLNVDRNRIDIYFNENVKLEDVTNKLVISPAQRQQAVARANGRRVTIDLRDSLKPNTTYTIDFADAVRDLNEGNILDGFAMDFATGEYIDSMKISGMVFEARNLEPAQNMVVGVYSADAMTDTTLTTLPLERVAKTNQLGQFTIRGLKPGSYRVFAIDDRNRDWHWDVSEAIAFSSFDVKPEVHQVEVTDTLRAADGSDSLAVRQAWRYTPDDILLTWYNERFKPQYLRDYERTDRQRGTFKFGTRPDTMPVFEILSGPTKGRKLSDIATLETRLERDSMVYWIRDTATVAFDSLLVAAHYQKTDTLNRLVWADDTLKLFVKGAVRQREKDETKEWQKRLEQREKDQKEHPDSVFPPLVKPAIKADLKLKSPQEQDLNLPMILEANWPIVYPDSAAWRLEIMADSVWKPVEGAVMTVDSLNPRIFNISQKWLEGERYRFHADSAAIADIYGNLNSAIDLQVTTKTMEDYGAISFFISDIDQIGDSAQVMVELLNKSDAPVAKVAASKEGTARFDFVKPDTYYARAYIDRNRNGEWDTGAIADSIQPEDVFYFTKKIVLRKNWDFDEDWALFETAVDLQKPNDVKRNKPKTRDRDQSEEDDEYDDYDDSGFGNQGYYDGDSWGNGSQYNNARRGNSRGRGRGLRNNTSDRQAR